MKIIRFIGSIYFTIAIIALVGVLLIVTTSLESVHGTEFAQKNFYTTQWFDGILSLLWLNIFCSTLLRFPFRKNQISFLITHVGILVLLFGALMTRLLGVEGQALLLEGQQTDEIAQSGYELRFTFPDGSETRTPLQIGVVQVNIPGGQFVPGFCPLQKDKASNVHKKSSGLQAELSVLNILKHAAEEPVVTASADPALKNRAIRVSLQSASLGWKESAWLMQRNPHVPDSDTKSLGPLKMILKTVAPGLESVRPVMKILDGNGAELTIVDLESSSGEIRVGDSGWKIRNFQYLPYAKVAGGKLQNGPPESGFNPAVEFEAVDPAGQAQRVVKFALFPDFESFHNDTVKTTFNFTVRFEGLEGAESESSSLIFYIPPEGAWHYKTVSKDQSVQEGGLESGQWLSSGWMDIQFNVEEAIANAKVSYELKESSAGRGPRAIEIGLPEENGQQVTHWLVENQELELKTAQGDLRVALLERAQKIPFSLLLKDFRKIDYPGTNNPSAFESDVILQDTEKKLTLEKTISMNNPLEYRGYKIFQTSYVQQPGSPEMSIFTVAKNPGIPFIYLGSLVTLLGAFLLFYVKPFANGKNGDKKP